MTVPLAQRRVQVSGIELSPYMAAKLREKVPEKDVPMVIGDMAAATAFDTGSYSLVYPVLYNTVSNLRTEAEQVECFRIAARHQRPGGAS